MSAEVPSTTQAIIPQAAAATSVSNEDTVDYPTRGDFFPCCLFYIC
jgi:hypothetical protein